MFPIAQRQLTLGPNDGPHGPTGPTGPTGPVRRAFLRGGLCRSRRVLYLLAAVVLMSLADLAITLVWVTQVGLAESNPLARWVIEQGSVGLLTAWKLITVVPAVVVFAALRHKAVAEAGAVVSCIVLITVTAHWYGYHADLATLTVALPAFEQGVDERWTVLASNPTGAGTLLP